MMRAVRKHNRAYERELRCSLHDRLDHIGGNARHPGGALPSSLSKLGQTICEHAKQKEVSEKLWTYLGR